MALARILLTAFISVFFTLAAEAEGQRVILVLDASGSMWGQINGQTKMDIAKDVVGKVVSTWKAEDELGLVAYGHREKGSCTDIETLIEPGSLDAGSFVAAVNALTPKGKTPMTQAVRQAAEALKYTEKQATVILVSDGIETCDPDPCAVASELEAAGIGFTVHTVGFGLDDQGAVGQLECLAKNTGGTAVLAQNADELEIALKKTVEAVAEEPAPQPEPAIEFNLTGNVIMAEGVDTLPEAFKSANWEVFKSVNGEKGEWIKTEYGQSFKTNIEQPGEYFVQASDDLASVSAPVTLEAGKAVKLDLSFEAGLITFKGMMDATQPMADTGAAWELLDANGQWITTKYGAEAAFFANAGAYRIRLSLGTAKVEQGVAFESGKSDEITLTLGGGVIDVKSVFAPGGPAVLDGASVELLKGEAAIDGKHEWITTTYGSAVQFKVQAGKYRVVTNQDYATGFTVVEVQPGQVAPIEVNVNGGFLAATSAADATIEVYSAEKDISGNRQYIATEYNGQVNKAFNAGMIHVLAKKPDNTVIAEKDVEIVAGQRTELTLP